MADVIAVTGEGSDGQEILGDDPNIPLETPDDVENIEAPDETEETPEETPEEEEVEEEEEEEEIEKEEPLSPRDEDIVKKLNTKDKTILKEFPQIRSALYEQKEFRKVFPSVEDAKESVEKAEILDILEDSILAGDPTPFMEQISSLDKEAFGKFTSNFLPTLYTKDPILYDKIVQPLAKNMLRTAIQQGMKSGNKNLVNSAKHLSQFLFESPDIPPDETTIKEDPKLNQEREAFAIQRRDTFRSDVQNSSVTIMTAKIERLIPKTVEGALRTVAIQAVLKGIGQQLNKDEYYGRQVASLFRKANKSNYAGDWGTRIQSLYTGQATKLLPAVLGIVNKEILGNRAKVGKPKPKVAVTSGQKVGQQQDPKEIWRPDPKTGKKLSDTDFLAS